MDTSKLLKLTGNLEWHWETGYEDTVGVIFHDDRGLFTVKDKTGQEIKQQSWKWTLYLGKYNKYVANVLDTDGKVFYHGPLTYSREKITYNNFYLSFAPKELTQDQWMYVLKKELKTELYTDDFPEAIKTEYDIQFETNQLIYDKLTKQHVLITGFALLKNSEVRYEVRGKGVKGFRKNSDLKLDLLDLEDVYKIRRAIGELDDV